MLKTFARLAGAVALCAALAGVSAGPASAAITTTHITSPSSSPFFTVYDGDSSDPQTINVAGTSNGTDTDQVDIRCYYGNGSYNSVASGVAVNADGTFSTTGTMPNETTCVLRAVPTGGFSNLLSNYTGPTGGFAYGRTYLDGNDKPYDFFFESSTLKATNEFEGAGDCGFEYGYLYDSSFGYHDEPWDCVAALYANDGGYLGGSELVVNGHDAFNPQSAYYMYNYYGSNQTGAPTMTVTRSINPATGEATITETDPLSHCVDADGNPIDGQGYYGNCDHFTPAGVSMVRTITESQAGVVVTVVDKFVSTDGASHSLRAIYDNYLEDSSVQAPGESTYTTHGDGTTADVSGSSSGTFYTEYSSSYQPGPDNVQGALTYLTQPTAAVWTSSGYDLLLRYDRTVPATGSTDITHVFSSSFTREGVRALGRGVEDSTSAPTVAITSPANGSVTGSDAATVVGTATDNVGVSSLKVNGIPTTVGADGSWSQRVPLTPGANTITAVAKDGSGQTSQAAVSVIYAPPAAPSCTVPKVVGQTAAAAAAAISGAGCTVGVTTQTPSKVAKGSIASQSRSAGAKLPAYFPIDLKVSSGPVGKAKLATKSVSVKKGAVTLQISCPKSSGNVCNGTAKIRTTTKLGGKRRTLGTKAFQAPAGKKRKTTFKLSKANAKLVKGHTVKAQVFIVFRDEAGKSRTTKANLTIKG